VPTLKKLLVVQVAALGAKLAATQSRMRFRTADADFPAVTCCAQALFRTATRAGTHGLVSNGLFVSDLRKVLFWEQAAALVEGPRIWEDFRARGGRVGMMFWQQSLGESVDLVLSPAPIHKHGGGMIQGLNTQPRELESRLTAAIGRSFNLMHYWGPLASRKSSDWIVAATKAVLRWNEVDLLFSYIPHLDYDLQRHGPESPQAAGALEATIDLLDDLEKTAAANGYDVLVFGDYAIESVMRGAVFPNLRLCEAGLFDTRPIRRMRYPDFFTSKALAVVDHQIAHVFTRHPAAAAEALGSLPGVAQVLDREAQRSLGIEHARGGDLLLIAEPGAWFAYPWWRDRREAPDFATHVDIHNKPGYDPCELFFGWPPLSVSMDTVKIRGTHGRTGPGTEIAWRTTCDFAPSPGTLPDLADSTRDWLRA
jgi:predicted AlkP superfamily pyrophosphatase or phosphodiesterase